MAQRTICIMGRVLDQDDGLGVYSANLLPELFRVDTESRYVVLLRTERHAERFASFKNVTTRVLPAKRKLLWDQYVVPRAAREFEADIVFNPKFSLPILCRTPGVFVLHGSDWYVNPQNYRWWDNLYIRMMMPIYCRKAKGLLAISQTIVDDLVRYAGVDDSKAVVSYAAPSPHFSPNKAQGALGLFRDRYRLPDKFILTVARAYHTGHGRFPAYPGGNNERLFRAYQAYRASGGNLPLVVAGYRIEEYIRAQGFRDTDLEGVHFIGYVPHEEIAMAYQLAEFFVLATLYESFAFPLVEAMAAGCPAIVPNTGACPEVAGGAARLIDPFQPGEICRGMLELDRSVEARSTLRILGLSRVQAFTWKQTAMRTLQVFERIHPTEATTPVPARLSVAK